MGTMNESQRQKFLSGLHIGILGLERSEGPPLVVPVWYAYEPERWFSADYGQ